MGNKKCCFYLLHMIEIDGSTGEGGGQVLRTALSVACVLQKPIRITNIRAGRSQPGLKAQHLTVCNLLAKITNAKIEGAALGSTEIEFSPGEISGGEYSFDIGTAGSITLLLQAALPVLAHAKHPSLLSITGGTHVAFSPTFDYFSEVFLPAAAKFGVNAEVRMLQAGFYPKGGGNAELKVQPSKLAGAAFEPQDHRHVLYSIISSGLPPHVAEREEKELEKALHGHELRGKITEVRSSCAGNAVTVWSGFVGSSSLGEAGKPAEKVAGEAAEAFLAEVKSGASVDSHLADQLPLYAALAEGKSAYGTSKFTQHLITNAEVLSALTGRNIRLANEREVTVE